jgi:hypothetical protein
MDKGDRAAPDGQLTTEQMSRRLAMLDERLDNLDSVVTSLVEKVMRPPLLMEISCPKCGEIIQINVTSNARLKS